MAGRINSMGMTMRRCGLFLLFTVAFMALAGCTATVQDGHAPLTPPGEVRIVSSELKSDGHRKAEIDGTVQNFTASTVYNVVVSGEVVGPQDCVWGQGSDRIERLNPNETKRFKIKINDVPPGQIQNHRVWIELNQ